jgi:hypothetical protein
MPKRDGDKRLVADIVEQLERGGPFNDPRPRPEDRLTLLAEHIPSEVQRSIDRMCMLRTFRPPRWYPKRTAADYRKLGRLLRKMGFTAFAEQIGASDHVTQEPPPRADAVKYYCASEAFFLMEMFSAKGATFTTGGPFQIIAQKLYEAVTGKEVDLERACDWVLKQRRKSRQHRTAAGA